MTTRSKIYFGLMPRRKKKGNWFAQFVGQNYKEIAAMHAAQKWFIEVDEKFNNELLKALYG